MDKKQQIIELRSQGMSYQKISDELGVDRSYAWRVCNGKEGQFSRPRKRIDDAPPALTEEQVARKFGAIETGAITETLVMVKLTMMGFDVWQPFVERRRSDFGVFVAGRLVRIQAKTAGYEVKTKRFRACLTTKGSSKKAKGYASGDFDFFIVKCIELEEYYVIPFLVGAAVSSINLYPHRDRLLTRDGYEEFRNAFNLLRG